MDSGERIALINTQHIVCLVRASQSDRTRNFVERARARTTDINETELRTTVEVT